VCRGPRDGNRVVTFYQDIYPRDNVLVGDWFDGPSGKQLHTIIAVGDDVVAREVAGSRCLRRFWIQSRAWYMALSSPVLLVALRAPSQLMRAGGGRGHWAPYRACVGSAREGDVDPPAGRSGGESRAVSEKKSRRII